MATSLKKRIDNLLDIYSLDDILEYNDMEAAEVIEFLFQEGKIEFPPEPVE